MKDERVNRTFNLTKKHADMLRIYAEAMGMSQTELLHTLIEALPRIAIATNNIKTKGVLFLADDKIIEKLKNIANIYGYSDYKKIVYDLFSQPEEFLAQVINDIRNNEEMILIYAKMQEVKSK